MSSTRLGRQGVVLALAVWLLGGGVAAWADGAVAAARAGLAQPAADEAKPPITYENLRFHEDWSSLRCADACARRDGSARLKALHLGPGVWLDLGGQLRLRYERFENFQFATSPAADDDWLLVRARLHADLHLGRNLRVFVEGIYAGQEERELGPRVVDENHGDLLNAFAEAHGRADGSGLGVRVGRQELLFGKQRLIGPLDWGNTRRSFECVSAWVSGCDWRLDGFYVQPVRVDVDDFDERDRGMDFAGVYYSSKPLCSTTVDAYALYSARDTKTWLGVTTDDERLTLGASAWGPIGGTRLTTMWRPPSRPVRRVPAT